MKGGCRVKFRECAGGIVFRGEEVFLLCNEKNEWVFPKGVVRNADLPAHTALARVAVEAGLQAEILGEAGVTDYEFYSISRKCPVHNRIRWYVMTSQDEAKVDYAEGFTAGGWFDREEATSRVTYTQDRELLEKAWQIYLEKRS